MIFVRLFTYPHSYFLRNEMWNPPRDRKPPSDAVLGKAPSLAWPVHMNYDFCLALFSQHLLITHVSQRRPAIPSLKTWVSQLKVKLFLLSNVSECRQVKGLWPTLSARLSVMAHCYFLCTYPTHGFNFEKLSSFGWVFSEWLECRLIRKLE